jgi:hypothetical protein
MRKTGTVLDVLGEREDVLACTTWPEVAWSSPDGKRWAPQDVLVGWGGPHISDRWACSMLARWVRNKCLLVRHLELPQPLLRHSSEDPTWSYVASLGDHTTLEPDIPFGRADLGVCWNDDDGPNLFVEFGTCMPGKFLFNVGSGFVADWAIVPYHSVYGFVFSTRRELMPLLRMPARKIEGGVSSPGARSSMSGRSSHEHL